MAYKIAKLMLEQAGTFLERTEAVRTALSLGMSAREIEEYLDWLDVARPLRMDTSTGGDTSPDPHRQPKAG